MNYWYTQSLEVDHPRKGPFIEVINSVSEPIRCLVIGSERNITDPQAIYGDGFFSLYVADKILKDKTGSLTIVDIDPQAIENCKIIMADFIGAIDIRFVVDDGLNWAGKDGFNLKYLDGGDQEWQTFEMFKKVDLRDSHVLLDDFNPGGKCDRVKSSYPFYKTYKCGSVHQMGFYERMENYGNETFKIGDLELPYYRGWKGNREATNERSIEVALGKWFSEKFNEEIVEMGAVLPYYIDNINHMVIDPYDRYEKCVKVDGEMFDYSGKNVLSVSSLEHIGNDSGYDKYNDPEKAIRTLNKIVNSAKSYLVCWGVGQHPKLDEYVKNSDIPLKIMARDNCRGLINNWTETKDKNSLCLPYASWDLQAGMYGNSICEVIVSNVL